MTTGKFKLSETIKFLSTQLNALTGHDKLSLQLTLAQPAQVCAGGRLSARVIIKNPERARLLNALSLHMEGAVQRGDRWQTYTETAEVAQNTSLGPDQELIVPLQLYIPEDAVLTEDGATWTLSARAVLDRAVDPRAQEAFSVLAPAPGGAEGPWESEHASALEVPQDEDDEDEPRA